jgi:hypothetical protein
MLFYDSILSYFLLAYKLTPWRRLRLENVSSCSESPEILHILWNPKVHYSVHKVPPFVAVFRQMNPVCPFVSLKALLILSALRSLDIRNGLFPAVFSARSLCALLSHACHMPRPFYSSWVDHASNIWRGIQTSLHCAVFPSVTGAHSRGGLPGCSPPPPRAPKSK